MMKWYGWVALAALLAWIGGILVVTTAGWVTYSPTQTTVTALVGAAVGGGCVTTMIMARMYKRDEQP